MITLENEQRGYYTLGFLNIKIHTKEDLGNLNQLISKQSPVFSTFLHEYIHFLQNFTTTSGLYSSQFYIQFLKYTISKIKENEDDIINLPLTIDNDYNRESLNKLNSIYLGQSGFIRNRVRYENYSSEKTEITDISDNNLIIVNKYFIEFTDFDTHKFEKYHFGTIALKEYVAHKIQNSFQSIQHPDIPYLIAELIIDKELPELKDNDNLKILLCDASLMNLYPAQFFFETIERLKQKVYPKNPTEFYNYIFKDISYDGKLGKFDNQIQLFNYIYDQIKYDYNDAFKSKIFINELNWFLHILKNARELRIKNPTFILNLINSKGKFTIELKRIIKSLGTPFFINELNDGGFVPPRKLKKIPNQTYILLAASELLFNAFAKNEFGLYGFCSKNFAKQNPTNELCQTNPFKKMNEPEACPFIQLSKTWGIHEKVYVR
ncbi:hypothetical protein AB3G34_05090 [Flavobacterium sp. WC2409]|uniref:Uncharacterized protein n=1 Tax=Flavobacterium sp. WC2409 TaxID=3234139 RepID=A0AB39W590_9FLAO